MPNGHAIVSPTRQLVDLFYRDARAIRGAHGNPESQFIKAFTEWRWDSDAKKTVADRPSFDPEAAYDLIARHPHLDRSELNQVLKEIDARSPRRDGTPCRAEERVREERAVLRNAPRAGGETCEDRRRDARPTRRRNSG